MPISVVLTHIGGYGLEIQKVIFNGRFNIVLMEVLA